MRLYSIGARFLSAGFPLLPCRSPPEQYRPTKRSGAGSRAEPRRLLHLRYAPSEFAGEADHSLPVDTVVRQLVAFNLADRRYALHLSAVERVFRVVEITPLPKAPEIVLGIVDIQGWIAPVLDIRRRFGLPARPVEVSDQLIVAHTGRRGVALVADAVIGVVQRLQTEITAADQVLGHLDYVAGVVGFEDGLILIHDLDTFLAPVEERALDQAMTSV